MAFITNSNEGIVIASFGFALNTRRLEVWKENLIRKSKCYICAVVRLLLYIIIVYTVFTAVFIARYKIGLQTTIGEGRVTS
jgi:hypothetical protein